MSEEEKMNQRVVGVRRARSIKRAILVAIIFAGVMCFWQLSRRDSEVLQGNGQGFSEEHGGIRVLVTNTNGSTVTTTGGTRGSTKSSPLNETEGDIGPADDMNRTTQKPPNSVTNSIRVSLPRQLNVSSKTTVNHEIAQADVDERGQQTNTTSLTPGKGSVESNGEIQGGGDVKDNVDDVNVTLQKDNAIEPSNLNIQNDGGTVPRDQEKFATNNESEENASEGKRVKTSQKPTDEVNNAKLEGSLSKEKQADLNETASNPTVDKPRYNYSEPRYSVSENGQFKLLKFVTAGNVNISSFNQSLKYSPFSQIDKVYLTLLSQGQIREIYSIEHHEKLRLVAFDAPTLYHDVIPIESCPLCGAIKSSKDINEILAFHVDRTLGIERALPATGRRFTQEELDHLGFDEANPEEVFPVMWFAKDLIHRGNFQKDQNSMHLSWKGYQDILANCQGNTSHVINCTDVNYSDWSRMAVLDFVMQNHDRLDRYCCGYESDEGEACFQNEIVKELDSCEDTERRFLVHILTSKSNPKQLVLLDNVGNINRGLEHLNYELLKGIRTIPKSIMENIFSEDFKDRLLKSMQWDAAYWKSTEDDVMDRMVDIVVQRVEKLQSYIKENGIMAT